MSKTDFNSYLIEAILHVLKQFSDKRIGVLQNKHGGSVKLILNKLFQLVIILTRQLIYDSSS